ncbi:hypothetical protein [Paeniglutamicibacter sp. NPDC091659]|uniref:hypothetical protein n=1 Tax=Paeniglutamicibacter sp. NPDC091659 TaxID=3364389 RepID=UPI0037F4EC83
MDEHEHGPLWLVYRWQNERNERAGHVERLHGVFTTRDAAEKALLRLRKIDGKSPGIVRVEEEYMGASDGYLRGFFEYDPAEYRRTGKRSPRPNRHKGFTAKNPEPYRP